MGDSMSGVHRRGSGRLIWTNKMNNDVLACKQRAVFLTKSDNPPHNPSGRKKGYMAIMKDLWENMGYLELRLTSQNLRDRAARLEKTLGDVGKTVAENVGARENLEEDSAAVFNESSVSDVLQNLQASSKRENSQYLNINEATNLSPVGLSEQTMELFNNANQLLALVIERPGDFTNRKVDTRTKRKPSKKDIQDINTVIAKLINQNKVSPTINPFGFIWLANCVLYSVVVGFLLLKGWKKQGTGVGKSKRENQQRWKRELEGKVKDLRRKISIAKSEIDRLKENRKLTKKGKKNLTLLRQECSSLSVAGLVAYMEQQKSALRKLKRVKQKKEKCEEARSLNRKFSQDPSNVYQQFKSIINEKAEVGRPVYKRTEEEDQNRQCFDDVEQASGFWKALWEKEGTGNDKARWLQEVKKAIWEKVPPPSEEEWILGERTAVSVIKKKKNWSSPGPDKIVNYWWKNAIALHVEVTTSFEAIAKRGEEYPSWFPRGRTTLAAKPGAFSSENQRPITCLNTIYKWFTSCILKPMDEHLDRYKLMEIEQRGARTGCSGTMDNLLIDRAVTTDSQRGKRNLSVAWVDVKKAYDCVDHNWLVEMMKVHRFPTWLCKVVRSMCRSWSTAVIAETKNGRELSEPIVFSRGLPQGDALCPRLFTLCINPVAWKLKATEGTGCQDPSALRLPICCTLMT